jgi:mannose-1-phosphate guanylyltransferase
VSWHLLVLAGGSGTRLWPLSRAAKPKHLLSLGPGGITLLRATIDRIRDLAGHIHVVTVASQAADCAAELEGLGLGPDAIIAEPFARGTGPALGLATAWIARDDPEALISSVHADHRVGEVEAYRAALVASAGWAAGSGGLATAGLVPTSASTAVGYIELAQPADPARWISPVARSAAAYVAESARALPGFAAVGFSEKPSAAIAEQYVAGGRHLWNLGLFAWPAPLFRDALHAADAQMATAIDSVVELRSAGDEGRAAEIYASMRTAAVEPLVFERARNLTVVRASFPWPDVGSWADLHEALLNAGEAGPDGNVAERDTALIDARNCTVISRGGRLVSVVGADGLVVVDTPDALLVVPADQSQRVKELVDRLRADGRTDVL